MTAERIEPSSDAGRALSGRDIGAQNVATLKHYLDTHPKLPTFRGRVNISAIASACQFDRKVAYDNPGCRELLDHAIEARGAAGIEDQIQAVDKLDPETQRLRAELSQCRELLA